MKENSVKSIPNTCIARHKGRTLVSCFECLLAHSPNARPSFHTAALASTTGSVATTMWNILVSKASHFKPSHFHLNTHGKQPSMISRISPYCFDLETWDLSNSVYTKIYTASVHQTNEFHISPPFSYHLNVNPQTYHSMILFSSRRKGLSVVKICLCCREQILLTGPWKPLMIEKN